MTKVTKIGVPADYMMREKEMDLDWIREQIHNFDFNRVDRVDMLLTYYFDINHEGLEPQYLTKAIRIPTEDLEKLHDIRKQTGMTIKLITHMILSIAYNQKIGEESDNRYVDTDSVFNEKGYVDTDSVFNERGEDSDE